MEFETEYILKLFFSSPAFVQIYFEAVANALDAEASDVTIHISSDGKIKPEHLEVTISDNGIGFTDERFGRFAQVKQPTDPYHKGFGRLIYLKYFRSVHIASS
jgi:signal transduction histidine kinase